MNEVDKEFQRCRSELWRKKGHICAYCGAEATQLHHIIPRAAGGDNRLGNLVPLCQRCHFLAHSKAFSGAYKPGRKSLQKPEGIEIIMKDYIDDRLTLRQACERAGVGRNTFYKWLSETDRPRKRVPRKRRHKR